MTEITIGEFLHDFRQNILASAESNQEFGEAEFLRNVTDHLIESGVCEGFDASYYRAPQGGMRVDGYWLNESSLDLFVSDFADRETVQSLTQTEIDAIFKRTENFFLASAQKNLWTGLEETSPGYGLSRLISERANELYRINYYVVSDRSLSERVTTLDDKERNQWVFSYHIWDISRLYRLHTSRGVREELEINFSELPEGGLPCLPAHLNSADYRSYLVVMPATVLAELYGKYGARLLESNVRSFLQARGNVNKGIRQTILSDPEMFFAYNNGITATARGVLVTEHRNQTLLVSMKDLQIVNGGQTTASLFHTQRKDKADLDKIFVQMKLSVVDEEKSEEIVPKISEYANTQNRVNAADFFSNHPYHIRMQEFSRRLYAPAQRGAQRESKWFYERARGQYIDAQSKLTPGERTKFKAQNPSQQMFTKTDLAKFENVWDDSPIHVNQGAQKNFSAFAKRIGQEWEKNPDQFNEYYFKRTVARAIIFRTTERLVSKQSWYDGGYRANVVAYSIAMLAKIISGKHKAFDFLKVWNTQELTPTTIDAIIFTAKLVHDDIMQPGVGVSNISEWCKRDACWIRLQTKLDLLTEGLPIEFYNELKDKEEIVDTQRAAGKTQRIINGIDAQKAVYEISAAKWAEILRAGSGKRLFSEKEISLLQLASRMPERLPTDKQSEALLKVLDVARSEGLYSD